MSIGEYLFSLIVGGQGPETQMSFLQMRDKQVGTFAETGFASLPLHKSEVRLLSRLQFETCVRNILTSYVVHKGAQPGLFCTCGWLIWLSGPMNCLPVSPSSYPARHVLAPTLRPGAAVPARLRGLHQNTETAEQFFSPLYLREVRQTRALRG